MYEEGEKSRVTGVLGDMCVHRVGGSGEREGFKGDVGIGGFNVHTCWVVSYLSRI